MLAGACASGGDEIANQSLSPKRPLITAAIPAFNSEGFVSDAIKSVLGQTYRPIECVVVDDGSTDATAEIVRSFKEVRYVRQDNGGDANARNRAIAEAHGDFVAFLDSDDVWLPDKLSLQMERFVVAPNLGMVYTGVMVVDEELRPLEVLAAARGEVALRNTLLVEKPYMTGVGSSGLVPAKIARKIGFDERLGASADWAFACKVAVAHPVDSVSKPLVLYRQHAASQVHRNLEAIERDLHLVWSELFSDGALDPTLRKYERRAHANLHLSLAASYFLRGDRSLFIRHLSRALMLRPDRVAAAFWRRYLGPPPS